MGPSTFFPAEFSKPSARFTGTGQTSSARQPRVAGDGAGLDRTGKSLKEQCAQSRRIINHKIAQLIWVEEGGAFGGLEMFHVLNQNWKKKKKALKILTFTPLIWLKSSKRCREGKQFLPGHRAASWQGSWGQVLALFCPVLSLPLLQTAHPSHHSLCHTLKATKAICQRLQSKRCWSGGTVTCGSRKIFFVVSRNTLSLADSFQKGSLFFFFFFCHGRTFPRKRPIHLNLTPGWLGDMQ